MDQRKWCRLRVCCAVVVSVLLRGWRGRWPRISRHRSLRLVVDNFYYHFIVFMNQIECRRHYCWQHALCTRFFIILLRYLPPDTRNSDWISIWWEEKSKNYRGYLYNVWLTIHGGWLLLFKPCLPYHPWLVFSIVHFRGFKRVEKTLLNCSSYGLLGWDCSKVRA